MRNARFSAQDAELGGILTEETAVRILENLFGRLGVEFDPADRRGAAGARHPPVERDARIHDRSY